MSREKDILFHIPAGYGVEFIAHAQQIDCQMVKNDPYKNINLPMETNRRLRQALKRELPVQVWEDKAKIKVKVSPGSQNSISMKRIAEMLFLRNLKRRISGYHHLSYVCKKT